MMKLDMKCTKSKCKRRLQIEIDPKTPSGELAKIAT